jgi:hypothetical protein
MKSPKFKQCYNCKIYKIKSSFTINKANKDGLGSYCKPCATAMSQTWKKGSDKAKAWQQKYQLKIYGATPEIYEELEKKQDGNCAICGIRRLRGKDRYLHLDHNHKTGEIRGLLCYICNTTLGKYEKWREQIDQYLNKTKEMR